MKYRLQFDPFWWRQTLHRLRDMRFNVYCAWRDLVCAWRDLVNTFVRRDVQPRIMYEEHRHVPEM